MSTSGSYNYSTSRDSIIRMAMLFLGKLGENESPTASENSDCSDVLNMMTKQWMGKQDFAPGLKVWTRRHSDLFLSASTGQYSLGPSGDHWTSTSYQRQLTAASPSSDTTLTVDSITNATSGDYIGVVLDDGSLFWTTINGAPAGSVITITTGLPSAASSGAYVFNYTTKAQRPLFLETCVLRTIDNADTPVTFMTVQDYDYLPTKSATTFTGDPTSVYYETQLTNGVLYTDIGASSDVTKRLHITYMESIQDFDNANDEPEYPQQWYLALVWGLAKQIAPMFNAPWTQEMQGNFEAAMAMAKEEDHEISTMFFQPGNDSLDWR